MARLPVFFALTLGAFALLACAQPAPKTPSATSAEAQGPPLPIAETWGLPAFMDADPTQDRARIEACLSKAEAEQVEANYCIDVVARPCLQLETNLSTAGMVGCLMREHDVWESLLKARMSVIEASATPAFLKTLRAANATWTRARDENCALFAAYHEGGTIAAPMGAGCMSDWVARRYLFLAGFEPPG